MLADAAQEVSGKLYVLGGGWNTIFVTEAPSGPVRHRHLALVAMLEIEWLEANEPIEFEINLIDQDQRQVLPEPITGQLAVGRPVNLPSGAEQVVPLVVNFDNLEFDRLGTYLFTLRAQGELKARAPFHVTERR